MNTLTEHDLRFALLRCPKRLIDTMKMARWNNRIFVGGGFLRSIVAREPINDIDIFVGTKQTADDLAIRLADSSPEAFASEGSRRRAGIYTTDNAHTITNSTPKLQIIHRWLFTSGFDIANSFDFTCCCAAFWYNGKSWKTYCDERFYPDIAAKRLVYRSPVRNEDAGGSALRVLKYYQKGYNTPLDSYAGVIARMVKGLATADEKDLKNDITRLLREVDPDIDPSHYAHLPAESVRDSGGNVAPPQEVSVL